jgi:pimeloyl-ACP methyl ester carboxylesterase
MSSTTVLPETFTAPSSTTSTHHIIFIPGNPGLIAWYTTYLAHLAEHLHNSPTPSHRSTSVFGTSLANFSGEQHPPVGLQGQIAFVEDVIQQRVSTAQSANSTDRSKGTSDRPTKIILIGHSVGSYIALEVIRRWRAALARHEPAAQRVQICGYVGVWATVVGLDQSVGGKPFVKLFRFVPGVPLLVRVLTLLLPAAVLLGIIAKMTGFPEDAVRTVERFLKSPMGVRESMVMVRDELVTITEDRWGEEIWGAERALDGVGDGEDGGRSRAETQKTKMVFYFGDPDHYVDEGLRDALIRNRGRKMGKDGMGKGEEEWRPRMEVDKMGVPHAFSLRKYDDQLQRYGLTLWQGMPSTLLKRHMASSKISSTRSTRFEKGLRCF